MALHSELRVCVNCFDKELTPESMHDAVCCFCILRSCCCRFFNMDDIVLCYVAIRFSIVKLHTLYNRGIHVINILSMSFDSVNLLHYKIFTYLLT